MTTTTKIAGEAMTDEQIEAIKQAALAATPQDIDGAESIDRYEDGSHFECPACGGEGCVPRESDFLNYDGEALGVQFYGIGDAVGTAEAYFRAAKPATVLALIARLERAALAPTPSAQEEAVRVDQSSTVTLTGAQLLAAFEFVAPDHPNDADQLECEVTIQYGDGHDGRGLYCWITEYPDEGAIRLDAAPAASAGDQEVGS
ncbi:UNVERIFIED_ORG: putative RNA-binding Zn-ribbon protein involved in translation (DUF1610 family) [Burkholderia sp. 1263]